MEIGKPLDLLILVVFAVLSGCYSIPLDQFFPFGNETEDILSNLSDDGSVAIQLNDGFVFYDTNYTTLYVSLKQGFYTIIVHLESFIYMHIDFIMTIKLVYSKCWNVQVPIPVKFK